MKRTRRDTICSQLYLRYETLLAGSKAAKNADGGVVTIEKFLSLTLIRSTVLFGLMAALQGCAISQFSSLGSGWFGSSDKPTSSWDPKVSEERLLAAAKSDPDGPADVPTTATGCPKFVVWPRDRHLTKYVEGREGDGLAIRYRGEITKSARECQITASGLVTVKYGFAGRVLLGPKGQAGQISLPVSVFVTDHNRDKIKTERLNITVDVPTERPIGYFSYVRRLSFQVPVGKLPTDYKLFVAFDRKKSR